MSNKYYFNKLNKIQQSAYHAMFEGLSAMEPSFYVPRLSNKELGDIYFLLRLDHPELFYSETFTYKFYENSESVELSPVYLYEKKKLKDHKQAMESRIKKLTAAAAKLSEKEKELYIHDFICQNVTYDKLKKPYSHEIIGPLGLGVSVCEGIAKTVKVLCDQLNIWCIIAISEANPEKGIKYRHAWNVLKIGGKYYHFDATFDNSLGKGGAVRYDYFNLCDRQIFRDHEPAIWQIPECLDADSSYYREKKLSFTKYEDVQKRSMQAAKKGKELIFQWRGSYLTKEVLKELLEIIQAEATAKNQRAIVSLNWPQAVFLINFKAIEESTSESELNIQEANEGELEIDE